MNAFISVDWAHFLSGDFLKAEKTERKNVCKILAQNAETTCYTILKQFSEAATGEIL